MKCFVSCVTYEPKLRPTMQCQVGLYFLSNSFLMKAAMSFSMLYFSRACGVMQGGGGWWLVRDVCVCATRAGELSHPQKREK